MRRLASCLVALFVLAVAAGDAQAYVNMEYITVANPGNANDDTAYGCVSTP